MNLVQPLVIRFRFLVKKQHTVMYL